MKKLINRIKKGNQKGFTLLELLIALAILAIIVAVAFPNFTTALRRAEATGVAVQYEKLKEACLLYHSDVIDANYPWPEEYSDNSNKSQLFRNTPAVTGWKGPYIDKVLTTNKWGGVTRVRYDNCEQFDLDYDGSDETSGKNCYLELTKVKDKDAERIDLDIDRASDSDSGLVEYSGGTDNKTIKILIAD